MSKTLSVVIPCFNEVGAVDSVLSALLKTKDEILNLPEISEVQIIVVDDASTDGSIEKVKKYDFVELIQNKMNQGYGASLNIGFKYAKGDYLAFLDMDDTYPPRFLIEMMKEISASDFDVIYGQRSFTAEGMSAIRGFGNWFYTKLNSVFLGAHINDTCTGFRLFRRRCLPSYLAINESSLAYSIEMTIQNILNEYKTKDFLITYDSRIGKSKLSIARDGWVFFRAILGAALRVHATRVRKRFGRVIIKILS